MSDNRVRMTPDEKDRLVDFVERVMTIGHGEVIIKITDHKVVFGEEKAQYQFQTNGGKK